MTVSAYPHARASKALFDTFCAWCVMCVAIPVPGEPQDAAVDPDTGLQGEAGPAQPEKPERWTDLAVLLH